VVSVGTDKQIIFWKVEEAEAGTLKTVELQRIETKNFLDIAISEQHLAAIGCNSRILVYTLSVILNL